MKNFIFTEFLEMVEDECGDDIIDTVIEKNQPASALHIKASC